MFLMPSRSHANMCQTAGKCWRGREERAYPRVHATGDKDGCGRVKKGRGGGLSPGDRPFLVPLGDAGAQSAGVSAPPAL